MINQISILGDTGFLVCKECKFCVLPTSIDSHFRKQLYRNPQEITKNLFSEVTKYSNLVWGLEDLEKTRIPSSFPFFFSELPLFSDGLACQDCEYFSRSTRVIQRHYIDTHDWSTPRGRGRVSKTTKIDVPWESNILCQRFFPSGPNRTYSRVNPKRPYTNKKASSRRARSSE